MKLLMVLALLGSAAFAQQPEPSALDWYFQQGEQALAQGRYEEAARSYEKVKVLSPATAEVHAKLGLIYFHGTSPGRFPPCGRR